jgi:two-component system, OmpR family, KDP operon response regulator KdpE
MSDKRVLVIDDEPQILRVLRRGLQSHGYEVVAAPDGRTALDIFRNSPVNMVITDLRMPDLDGVSLCSKIRALSNVPIVVLSVKGDEETKIQAFDAGADDYVTKPFGIGELVARLRALSRRTIAAPSSVQASVEAGDFRCEPEQRRITVRGKPIHLTPKEYDLLLFFMANHSRVLTHRAILSAVWGGNSAEQSEYLRVFVGQLRKKIERDSRSPKYLVTEPWIGYRFNPS